MLRINGWRRFFANLICSSDPVSATASLVFNLTNLMNLEWSIVWIGVNGVRNRSILFDYNQKLADVYLYRVLMRSVSWSLVESLSREMKRLIRILLGQFELKTLISVLTVCCLPEFNYLKSIETTRFGSKLLEEFNNPIGFGFFVTSIKPRWFNSS